MMMFSSLYLFDIEGIFQIITVNNMHIVGLVKLALKWMRLIYVT
jgi:hypothetical protein